MFMAALVIIAKTWKRLKYPLANGQINKTYSEMLRSPKKERRADTHCGVDEPWGQTPKAALWFPQTILFVWNVQNRRIHGDSRLAVPAAGLGEWVQGAQGSSGGWNTFWDGGGGTTLWLEAIESYTLNGWIVRNETCINKAVKNYIQYYFNYIKEKMEARNVYYKVLRIFLLVEE